MINEFCSANLTHLQPSATSKQCSISESNKRDKNEEREKEEAEKDEGAKTKEETKEADIVKNEVMSEQQMPDNPPLVEGDDDEKNLKLQFDLSQFDPEEVCIYKSIRTMVNISRCLSLVRTWLLLKILINLTFLLIF